MSEQHWQVPSLDRNKDTKELETLKIGDRLVYLWMKTYADYNTQECFPSYKEIATKINNTSAKCSSQCTENYVKLAIKRLESVGWIKVKRKPGYSNTYTFLKYQHFEKFYKDFLNKDIMTWKEKDFYIQLQQYIFITEEEAYFTWDYGKIAKALHLSYPTVKSYIISLKNKQIFTTIITTMKDQETHLPIIKTTVDLQSIGQEDLIKQIIKNTVDIAELKDADKEQNDRITAMEQKIAELEAKLAKEEVGD